MKRILLLSLLVAFAFRGSAQQSLWTPGAAFVSEDSKVERRTVPTAFSVFSLDLAALTMRLKNAPSRSDWATEAGIEISFPDAAGHLGRYRVYDAPVMAPKLQAKYPDMRSYIGIGIDDPAARIRFSITQWGLHTMAFTGDGETVYIEPYTKDKRTYIVYNKSVLPNPGGFLCGVTDEDAAALDLPQDMNSASSVMLSDGIYRTYRLAVSTTIEYSAYHITAAGLQTGTTPQKRAAVQAAIVVSITRVNQVYETDLAVHLELVEGNDQLITISSDNFTNNNGNTLLGENQTYLDANLGTENYDIGHIFSTGGGGIAALGSVCNTSNKGRGVTGSNAPVGDNYDIDYVAHEMGHQFGGTHTFNGLGTNCTTGTRTNATAVEPGSGTTIMAYAGICNPVNVQNHSDAHFSYVSIQQINNLVNGAAFCSSNELNGNTPPTIVPLKDYTIPFDTPFILKGNGSDVDDTALTYCWEQKDNQISQQPPVSTNTNGPNFRSRPPSASPDRYLPPLGNVLGNNLTPNYEVISSVARTYNFALTVRDNASPNGGQTQRDDMVVTVAETGPFEVLSPNTALTWESGSNQTVTWDVGGTTGNGVNTPYVDIYQGTTTGGFGNLLASKVPNDGSEVITVPTLTTTTNRIMVAGHNNIFYDVSNANFQITNPAVARFALSAANVPGQQNKAICPGTTVSYLLNYAALGGFTGTTTLSATGNPAGTTITFTPATITATGNIIMTVSNTASAPIAFNTIVVTGTSGALTRTVNLYLDVKNPSFGTTALLQPANGTTNQPTDVTLNWNFDSVNASSYLVQVSTNSSFSNIVSSGEAITGAFTPTGLATNTTYYWRVAPRLGDCSGAFSSTYFFTTGSVAGIDAPTKLDIAVYPNPSNGSFTLQADRLTSAKTDVRIFDLRGRMIFEKSFEVDGTMEETISLPNAEAGMYLMQISDGQRRTTKRILVK